MSEEYSIDGGAILSSIFDVSTTMCHRSGRCLPVVTDQLLTRRVHNKQLPYVWGLYSAYLRFQPSCWLWLVQNNRSAVGRSVLSTVHKIIWSRLNCWLVHICLHPTIISQPMADLCSVRYVPVASAQLLTLTPAIDVQVYSVVYWHLLSSLSCVSSPMWRLLWQRARTTCAQDLLPPLHHP